MIPERQTMVFDSENYKDMAAMDKDMCAFIHMLLRNRYDMKVTSDMEGLIMIEYNPSPDCGYGSPELMWLETEEVEDVWAARDADANGKEEDNND